MNIFNLHRDVLADYRDFVRSFLVVADEKARRFVDKALEEEARLWPHFLVQVSPSYHTRRWIVKNARATPPHTSPGLVNWHPSPRRRPTWRGKTLSSS